MGSASGVKIKLKRNCSLSKHGYGLDKSESKRHRALGGALAEFGTSYVIKKLNVLAIYRKNDPKKKTQFDIVRKDIAYVQKLRQAMTPQTRNRNLQTTRYRRSQETLQKG